MFKKILVPTDGSELSGKAVQAAVDFARSTGAALEVLSVAEPYPYSPIGETAFVPDLAEYEKQALDAARNVVGKVAILAEQAGVTVETHLAQSFNPYEEIVKVAEKSGCDAIFMASHGRKGLNRLFIGSETQKVLAHTTLPVLVFR